MKSFEKVIGYDGVKQELMQICDMIKNRDIYERLGAKMPSGILLSGEPGIGKTLMAKCFIEESGLKAYTVRKKLSEDFASYVAGVFEEAKKTAPCIVLLDDMDKFANEDNEHRDAGEYVAVQSCIDEAKGGDVFIIATVNDIDKLPESLIRAGRFDRIIRMEPPTGKDSKKIIEHYLRKKGIADFIKMTDIVKMLHGQSCAEVETVINEAAIHAAHNRKTNMDTEDIIYAFLRNLYSCPENSSLTNSSGEIKKAAAHEAGHAVMCEILNPGGVGLASIRKNGGSDIVGIVRPCKKVELEEHILISLAGKAAVELVFGICDDGSEGDIRKAIKAIKHGVEKSGTNGLGMITVREYSHSETINSRVETVVQAQLESYMFKAKKILAENRDFLDRLAQALIEKETLLNSDIKRIRDSIEIKEVAV